MSRRSLLLLAAISFPGAAGSIQESRPAPADAAAEVWEIVAFGERIGLPPTSHFRRVDRGRGAIHILYACPPFELRRHYNEIYRTHSSDLAVVEKAADVARARGEDVRIESVEATAEGSCPVTRALLDASLPRRVYVVLHENAHVALRCDLTVEEPLADAIASIGCEAYLEERFGPDSPQLRSARRSRARYDRLCAFVEEVYEGLALLYATLPADPVRRDRLRRDALEEARGRFADLVAEDGWGFERDDLNNAFLTRQHTFARYRPLAFAAAGAFERPREAIARILAVPESEERAIAYLRRLAAPAPATPGSPR